MRSGGSTTIGEDGKVIASEEPTRDHPEGNRARPEADAAPVTADERGGRAKRGGKE